MSSNSQMSTSTNYQSDDYLFQSSKSHMDKLAEFNTYTVYELLKDGVVFSSTFSSYKDAKEFVRNFTSKSSSVYLFKTYCKATYEPETYEEDSDTEYIPNEQTTTYRSDTQYDVDLSEMVLRDYGKGYLLVPHESHEYFGEKYFQDGWWIPSQNGWFFKAEYYDFLIESGAFYDGSDESIEDTHETMEAAYTLMTLRKYKNGFLLMPPKEHIEWGIKYYHGGFWNETLRGWIFNPEYYDFLIECGAKSNVSTNATKTTKATEATNATKTTKATEATKATNTIVSFNSSQTFDMTQTYFEQYKRGYIVKPNIDCNFVGEKYLYDGFWNQSLEGWIFRSDSYEFLLESGSLYIHEASNTNPTIKTEGKLNLQMHYSYDESSGGSAHNSLNNSVVEFETADSEFINVSDNTDYFKPSFVKYRNNWLLKADTNYYYDGVNTYFEGGKYNHRQHGWIFSNEDKESFMLKFE